jgi:tRNA pseudouridine32 synthase / 23S rRNA pseudouridine746 synthase
MTTVQPRQTADIWENPEVPRSRLRLPDPASGCATLLEYLVRRFPHVDRSRWERRLDDGKVSFADGTPIGRSTPYRAGATVLYRREVEDEPPAGESETILFHDDRILVADKPHGMPVIPAGDYLARSLLVRLQRATGHPELAPAHRLDRDTAGIVLFVVDPSVRGAYHQLFAEGRIEREYRAIARVPIRPPQHTWEIESRIGPGEPWFRRRVVPGRPNAATRIELVDTDDGLGLFRIRPRTGKKHQIRLHMAGLGYPILGDRLYPDRIGHEGDGPPLQLLATRLGFRDPVTGSGRSFQSKRTLAMSPRYGS